MSKISYMKIRGNKPHNPMLEALIYKLNEGTLASYQISAARMGGHISYEEVLLLENLFKEGK